MNRLLAAFVALFLFPQGFCFAGGLAIHPMEQFVSPRRPAIYTATNSSDKAIAVEVFAETWTISESGEEIRERTNDLVVFPPQFILKGHTSKRIKVGSRNRTPITSEKPYRVTIRELPVTFELQEGQVTQVYMANAYRTSFYLQPRKKSASIDLVSSELSNGKLHLRFENPGNVHTHLQKPTLRLFLADGQEVEVGEDDLLDDLGGQNLHAGITRDFSLDLEGVELDSKPKSAELTIRSGHDGETKSYPLTF